MLSDRTVVEKEIICTLEGLLGWSFLISSTVLGEVTLDVLVNIL